MRWQRLARIAPIYLASVMRREWQLAILVLVGLAPGVAVLTAWLHLASLVESQSAAFLFRSWLLPDVLLDIIGPSGVLVGSGVVTLLIGGLGLANAYLASVERRWDELALLRSLGLGRREIVGLLLLEILSAGLLGSTLGIFLGWGLARASWPLARSYFDLQIVYISPGPALGIGLLTGLLATCMFMGISVLAVGTISIATILRGPSRPPFLTHMQALHTSTYGTLIAGGLTLLPALLALNWRPALTLAGLAIGLSVLLNISGWLLTQIFLRLPTASGAPLWSLAVQGLARHPRHTAGMSLAMITGAYAAGMAALTWLGDAPGALFSVWVASFVLVAGGSLVFTSAALAALERRREFGLLVALGGRPNRVRRLILLEYGIVAVGGGALGAVLALANWFISSGGGSWWMALLISCADIGAAICSAWIGALPVLWRVSRRSPGEALRV